MYESHVRRRLYMQLFADSRTNNVRDLSLTMNRYAMHYNCKVQLQLQQELRERRGLGVKNKWLQNKTITTSVSRKCSNGWSSEFRCAYWARRVRRAWRAAKESKQATIFVCFSPRARVFNTM